MSTTYLQAVNKVQLRLRETQTASVSTSSYSQLIGEYVQQALSEVENACDWNCLRTTIQLTTASGTNAYALTGVGNTSFNVLHVYNDTEDVELKPPPSTNWMTQVLLNNSVSEEQPIYWDVNGIDGSGDPVVNFYPPPDGVYLVNVDLKSKTTLSADSDKINVPIWPVVLRATFLALDERGDDQGLSLEALDIQYRNALADAIAYDMMLNEDELTWEVE